MKVGVIMECHILSCTIQERIRGDSVRMYAGKWKAFQQQMICGGLFVKIVTKYMICI